MSTPFSTLGERLIFGYACLKYKCNIVFISTKGTIFLRSLLNVLKQARCKLYGVGINSSSPWCESSCVSSYYLTERRTSDNGCRHMASLRCDSEYAYSGGQLERKLFHTADIHSSSPLCETSNVSSDYITERRTSDNGSRHMASLRCESENEL